MVRAGGLWGRRGKEEEQTVNAQTLITSFHPANH